jgi:acyl carrier protein
MLGSQEVGNVSHPETREILHSIINALFDSDLCDEAFLAEHIQEVAWEQQLSSKLQDELNVHIAAEEIRLAGRFVTLVEMVESRFARDSRGRSIAEIYALLERFVREELSHKFNYHWYASWKGDVLSSTDSLDDVELVIRMEGEFGFSIPDRDLSTIGTIGQTVRYLWRRSSEQLFAQRCPLEGTCRHAFVFHELRRLLMIRAGVGRTDIRLNTMLGDLMPTWHFQFWKQLQTDFGVPLPYGTLFSRSLGLEKRTTIRGLVILIVSSEASKHQPIREKPTQTPDGLL